MRSTRVLLTWLYRLLRRHLRVQETVTLRGHVRIQSYDAQTHALVQVVERENVVCTVGKIALLHWLAQDGIATTGVQYLAVGTSSVQPQATDTQLGSELARQAATLGLVAGTTATVQVFFTASQANGTWTEVGAFGNGASGTANAGTLFGHALLSPTYSKTSALETVLSYDFSFA